MICSWNRYCIEKKRSKDESPNYFSSSVSTNYCSQIARLKAETNKNIERLIMFLIFDVLLLSVHITSMFIIKVKPGSISIHFLFSNLTASKVIAKKNFLGKKYVPLKP